MNKGDYLMNVFEEVKRYNVKENLATAVTPPSSWYTSQSFAELENRSVFSHNWIVAGRADQVSEPGQYFTLEVSGEPIVVVMSDQLRAFYNVCRHHASVVMTREGSVHSMRCPYHGWTYNLDGSLRSIPQFEGAEDFRLENHGLKSLRVEVAGGFVFVCLSETPPTLEDYLGKLLAELEAFGVANLRFYRRVVYEMDCNWKVFVDNYLDGGYHVPILHKGLNSAIDYKGYDLRLGKRHATQSCEMSNDNTSDETRRGSMANYIWLYPNIMFNFYDEILDTNLVLPVSENSCKVVFDFYFSEGRFDDEFKEQSIRMSDQIQTEDEMICLSVQKGLQSRAYDQGRLSPEKEAGEQLFHRLLHRDLMSCFSNE